MLKEKCRKIKKDEPINKEEVKFSGSALFANNLKFRKK